MNINLPPTQGRGKWGRKIKRNRRHQVHMRPHTAHRAVRYNSGHSFETRIRIQTCPFVKYWTLLVSCEA